MNRTPAASPLRSTFARVQLETVWVQCYARRPVARSPSRHQLVAPWSVRSIGLEATRRLSVSRALPTDQLDLVPEASAVWPALAGAWQALADPGVQWDHDPTTSRSESFRWACSVLHQQKPPASALLRGASPPNGEYAARCTIHDISWRLSGSADRWHRPLRDVLVACTLLRSGCPPAQNLALQAASAQSAAMPSCDAPDEQLLPPSGLSLGRSAASASQQPPPVPLVPQRSATARSSPVVAANAASASSVPSKASGGGGGGGGAGGGGGGGKKAAKTKAPDIGTLWGLLILGVAYVHHSTTGFALPALLPLINEDLHLTDGQGALLTSGYTVRSPPHPRLLCCRILRTGSTGDSRRVEVAQTEGGCGGVQVLYAAALVPVGLLADRADRPRLLAAGIAAWSLLTMAASQAPPRHLHPYHAPPFSAPFSLHGTSALDAPQPPHC